METTAQAPPTLQECANLIHAATKMLQEIAILLPQLPTETVETKKVERLYYTPGEVARMMGVAPQDIYAAIRCGKLRSYKTSEKGRTNKIVHEDVIAYRDEMARAIL